MKKGFTGSAHLNSQNQIFTESLLKNSQNEQDWVSDLNLLDKGTGKVSGKEPIQKSIKNKARGQ